MGVKNLSDLMEYSTIPFRQEKSLNDFKGKKIAFDAFNVLYQFLSSIRDSSGAVMADNEGRVTSHLIGLLTRNSQLLQKGIKIVYVFDGESDPLKKQEVERRKKIKAQAKEQYEEALEKGDLQRAKRLAARVSHLTPQMVEDSKILLKAMGIPVVDAPGEGEAQCAQMAIDGVVDAAASQDYDALLFGAPTLVRNLNLSGRRTLPSGRIKTINPEEINLRDLLDGLQITSEQLIDLGILLGSDFNPDGFKGIGPKTAYKLIKKYGSFNEIKKHEPKVSEVDVPYERIKEIFLNPNVEKKAKITFGSYDPDKILHFLVEERGFSVKRHRPLILKTAREIEELEKQTSLDSFF